MKCESWYIYTHGDNFRPKCTCISSRSISISQGLYK